LAFAEGVSRHPDRPGRFLLQTRRQLPRADRGC
jgi:hypothetical protein